MDPASAVTKRSRSVRRTPVRPPSALNATVTRPHHDERDQMGETPSSTPAILMAASVTVAMIMTLKNTPR
jgi:hypothetical protein